MLLLAEMSVADAFVNNAKDILYMQVSCECNGGGQAVLGRSGNDQARFVVLIFLQMCKAASRSISKVQNLCPGLQPKQCTLCLQDLSRQAVVPVNKLWSFVSCSNAHVHFLKRCPDMLCCLQSA